jgi:deoxyribonuclease NucA/NucB
MVVGAGSLAGVLLAFVSGGTGPGWADGPKPITDCSDDAQLRADVAAGGSYVFTCSGTMALTQPLVVTKDVTIDGADQRVTISDASDRVFTVNGGTLTLHGGIDGCSSASGACLSIEGSVSGAGGDSGAGGTPGTNGKQGQGNECTTATPERGGDGTAGGNGKPGGDGKPGRGGALYVAAGATASLQGVEVSGSAVGGPGGTGGAGGWGGAGGRGGDGDWHSDTCSGPVPAASGGNGASGGSGGTGGNGGDGQGGGAYVESGGTLEVTDSQFSGTQAIGGSAGSGGQGGDGGSGGDNGTGYTGGTGGNGGNGGGGAKGGDSGASQGGAIYSQGSLTLDGVSLDSSSAGPSPAPGRGGDAGSGGGGGSAPDAYNCGNCWGQGGNGGNGGTGGAGGSGRDSVGGAIDNEGGTLKVLSASFKDDSVSVSQNDWFGGRGGTAGSRGEFKPGNWGAPGDGGAGGNGAGASNASIAGSANVVSVTYEGDKVTAGPAGSPGTGGGVPFGDPGPNGKDGAKGSAGAAGQVDPGGSCRIHQNVKGWIFDAPCPDADKVDQGARNVKITAPSGWDLSVPDYAFPVEKKRRDHLAFPIVLPDIHLGPFTAFANTLDRGGFVTVGSASLSLPHRVEADAQDLTLGPGPSGSASAFDATLFDQLSLSATDVTFQGRTLKAGTFQIGLPGALGGAVIGGKHLQVGAGGVSGTLTEGRIAIGDMVAEFKDAQLTPNGFRVGTAALVLPSFLGNSRLEVTGLEYDGATGKVSFTSASGRMRFKVGSRAEADAHVSVELLGKDSAGRYLYRIKGGGDLTVAGVQSGSEPLFKTHLDVEVQSVDCPYTPPAGVCRNGAYLHLAELSVSGPPVPLGATGLAVSGLGGSVRASHFENAPIDADGVIHGVTYTFGLETDLQTFPRPTLFSGHLKGALSTSGNFGATLRGAALQYIHLTGGVCAVFDPSSADAVCDREATGKEGFSMGAPGIYLAASLGAGFDYDSGVLRARAEAKAQAAGRIFPLPNGGAYVDAEVGGRVSIEASSALLPGGLEGSAGLLAEVGRFAKPGAGTVLGIKGSLDGKLHAQGPIGSPIEIERHVAIFVDENGNLTQEGVQSYQRVTPGARAAALKRSPPRTYPFAIAPGAGPTLISAGSPSSAPTITLTAPDGLQIVARANGRGKPTIKLVPARGRRLTLGQLHSAYVIVGGPSNLLAVYLPTPVAGRWTARLSSTGGQRIRLAVAAERGQPSIRILRPAAGKTIPLRGRRARVTIRGALRGAPRNARVSLYATAAGCTVRAGRRLPRAPGIPLTLHLPVHRGHWSYALDARRAPPGRYAPYATLDNGAGPLVEDCARGTIAILRSRRAATRAPAPAPPPARLRHVVRPQPPGVKGLAGCRWAVNLGGSGHADGASPSFRTGVPVFKPNVQTTPCIAANDAAAITGRDATTNAGAVTVRNGAYAPFTGVRGWVALHYGPIVDSGWRAKGRSRKNRQAACGARPFRNGGKPGPVDWTIEDLSTHQHSGGDFTSCDEFPFASTDEGGAGAIIRGVTPTENSSQGGQLSAFLQREDVRLHDESHPGLFYVCVPSMGVPCPSG